MKAKVVRGVCRGPGASLTPPFNGEMGVVLTVGSDSKRYCASFGGLTSRNDSSLLRRRKAPAPGACPAAGSGTTTSSTMVGATTTSSATSTTATTVPPGPCCNGATFLTFTTADAPGDCGDIINVTGSLFAELACSGLYFGGGGNSVPLPATVPDQGVSTVSLDSCTGQSAVLGATTNGQTGTNRTCSSAGCLFGAPLAIPNANSTPTSTCVINTVSSAAAGTLNCATGAAFIDLPLTAEVYLTGDREAGTAGIQPCPRCESSTCVGGPNDGQGCTPGTSALNPSYPTSHDCPPAPSLSLGGLPIGFALSTGTVSWTATPATNDDETQTNQARVFAGFCRDGNFTGSFLDPAQKCWENGVAVGPACVEPFETCEQRNLGAFGPNGGAVRTITAIGTPLTGILGGPAPATLVSIFGVPPTYNATVDAAGNLPGPGATALPGSGELCETLNPCVPPVVPTTTTLPGGTTTTSTTLAPTTSTMALTTTSTSTTTSTTLFVGCPPPATSLGQVGLTTTVGSPDCGGAGLVPAPQAPFSGAVLDGTDTVIADLGLGCLYVGGGLANALPPAPAPAGAEALTNVDSINGTALTLAASDGDGIVNCTRGWGPALHCVNGDTGTDGNGACAVDADCGNGTGICLPDANCFFGPPIPLSPPTPALATCIVNAFATDVCGALDTSTLTSSLQFSLSTRLYLTQDPVTPCPQCIAGTCTAGERAGLACSGGIGADSTSNECPPLGSQYVGQLFSNPIAVSTGPEELVADANGFFCPGQVNPGALGTGLTGRTIQQAGAFDGVTATYAGNICAASSGNPLVDSVEDLPGPVSVSFTGSVAVCLGPLCL